LIARRESEMVEERASLRWSGLWGAVAFGVALAVVIGLRLDQAALAVLVGLACGVGASIPTSLLIITVLRRWDARGEESETRYAHYDRQTIAPSPTVLLVTPPDRSLQAPPEARSRPMPTARQFSIIGEEEISDAR
jgi:hypothetical protein